MINYIRRNSSVVKVGNVCIGGNNPIRIQSMLNTSTMDTEASVNQAIDLIKAGSELVRLTTQGEREAKNMALIREELNKRAYNTPLVADVHFNAKVAEEAALHVEKVRVNPGNYANSIDEIEHKFVPFLNLCKQHNTAIRLGVNHGSLNKRILEKYGDTPEGMTESCLEFLRICKRENFSNVIISVKASNTRIMVQTVRQMARRMQEEEINFPLHLGVTEAGNGEDGRIKSAVGIGTLLSDGLGDTIRVSLSESPVAEIPVAQKIVDFISRKSKAAKIAGSDENLYNHEQYNRRETLAVGDFGGNQVPLVIAAEETLPNGVIDCVLSGDNALGEGRLFFANLKSKNNKQPVVLTRVYNTSDIETLQIEASIELGPFFIDGLGDGIRIVAPNIAPDIVNSLSYGILQATGARITKTEYISCPSCGRTLFDIESTIEKIKAATSHLKPLKIGIMGCVVNGPGEMADADYGYVGAGVGRVSLYRGQQCVEKNIPEDQAVEHLIALIRSDGRWV